MSGWLEPLIELAMDGVVAVVGLLINDKVEKSDLQKLLARQREEHAVIVRQLAARGKQRSLRGYDLTGITLNDVDLTAVDLTEASFRDARVFEADFQEANLTSTDFSGAYLVDVNFARANLNLADFTDATLQNVDFSQANLRGASFSQTKELTNCIWDGVYINSQTELKQEIRSHIFDSF